MSFLSDPPRSVLFVPTSRPRMVAKATSLNADLVVLDLEDAVAEAEKDVARQGLQEAIAAFDGRPVAVRVNAAPAERYEADLTYVTAAGAAYLVLPKVEDTAFPGVDLPVIAMIETPVGVLNSAAIARSEAVIGLMAGTNDLAASLRLPSSSTRTAMSLALQTIVLAARAAGCWAIDGVHVALDDPESFAAECREGRTLGFDGKSLIHPNQVDPANRYFSPSDAELDEAKALIEAASTGAVRWRGRMVEDLHVRAARALLSRAHA